MTASLRVLPRCPAPVRYETIGSYLHRVAEANHLRASELAHLIGLPHAPRREHNKAGRWNPENLNRLGTLTGRSPVALTHAIPVLAAIASPRRHHPPLMIDIIAAGRVQTACRLCTSRRGIHTLVILNAPLDKAVCSQHHRWLPGGEHLTTSLLPEIAQASRRLHRDRQRTDIHSRYEQARRLTDAWFTLQHDNPFAMRWAHRLERLPPDPYGHPQWPSAPRIEAITYPETVALTRLLATTPATHSTFTTRAGDLLGTAIPHTLPPGKRQLSRDAPRPRPTPTDKPQVSTTTIRHDP